MTQRPPNKIAPSILFAGGASDWVRRVHEKHKQLSGLSFSSEKKRELEAWVEIQFIQSILTLEGVKPSDEVVARVVHSESDVNADSRETQIRRLLVSLRRVSTLAHSEGKHAELTLERLLQFHNLPGAELRRHASAFSGRFKAPAPEHLDRLIEAACLWYNADSFVELNPTEQAGIVLLRLLELQPFDKENERTGLLAASLFTMRADLPPLIIKPELSVEYARALDEAAAMNTKPIVELIAKSIDETLSELIERASR